MFGTNLFNSFILASFELKLNKFYSKTRNCLAISRSDVFMTKKHNYSGGSIPSQATLPVLANCYLSIFYLQQLYFRSVTPSTQVIILQGVPEKRYR